MAEKKNQATLSQQPTVTFRFDQLTSLLSGGGIVYFFYTWFSCKVKI